MENTELKIKIKKLYPDTILPERAYPTDSGLDLYIHHFEENPHPSLKSVDISTDTYALHKGFRILVNTGICATVGPGYEIQIRPKSGLALKNGISVLNTPGTVDESYRGAICVLVINLSGGSQILKVGMKIAQLVVCPVVIPAIEVVEDLSNTERSSGGFGSTGVA